MEFVRTKRGWLSLWMDGYKYRKDYGRRDKIFWKCVEVGCPARCVSKETEEITKVCVCNKIEYDFAGVTM